MATATAYPVRVEARLDEGLSRWMWLVKWFLAIPHYVVLALLWTAYMVMTMVAFFAILFTGRYPRGIFEFNVGVLRWSWRVADYSFGVLGTDRYPPFTLADVPDYPAHLDVEYPQSLSRGLVLVKWWLLAIPHYLIVGIFAGGGSWLVWTAGRTDWSVGGNLIGILVLVAAVSLAFTGRYPQALFDLILGLNRWAIRVMAYAGLMTDEYPPFRLDTGGTERTAAGVITAEPATGPQYGPPQPPPSPARGWTAGPIIGLIIGAMLAISSFGLFTTGTLALWTDQVRRDEAGFVSTDAEHFETGTYALLSEGVDMRVNGLGWMYPGRVFGDARVRVTASDESARVFVGVASTADVQAYLSGAAHATVTDVADARYSITPGAAPSTAPGEQTFWAWAVSASGAGTQSLVFPVTAGDWTIAVMNADGSAGIDVRADIGATLPSLPWFAAGLLFAGLVALAIGALLMVLAIRRATIA